jgi:Zn-dependent protease with chaperone function
MGLSLLKRTPLPIVLTLAAQAYGQSAGPVFPDPGKTSMSRDKQRALGLQTAAEVYKQMPVLPDSSPETQCVRQIGQKLVATIPAEHSWPFEFHVVAQKEINAFALPGGPMFINIGTITSSANEAQLAGVMAHEMSHVYMQHSAKQAGKAETTSVLAGLAGAVLGGTVGGGAGGLVGELGQMGIQMGAEGLMLKYSRGDEAQADEVGAVIMYKAGYNPQALADFFKTLEGEGKAPPQFFSDHPNPGNRERDIQKEIAEWPAENYAGNGATYLSARQHATGVKAYTAEEIAQGAKSGEWAAMNRKNGATFNPPGGGAEAGPATNSADRAEAGVLPSQKMVTANLGSVKIEHPDNWKMTAPQKDGQFFTIAPPAGVTEKGVGYGVLVNGVAPQQGGRMSIDEVTTELVKSMQQNNGLEPLGSAEPVSVGKVQGRSVMFHSPSPVPGANGQPQLERDWMVTLPQKDGAVVFMIFVAPQAEFARFQPTFDLILKSVQLK